MWIYLPSHIGQVIGFDVGDMVHWVYGFYFLIPRNPVGEPQFFFFLQIQGLFLIVCVCVLLIISFVVLRNAKLGNQYDKNLIYAFAILQLIASLFYETSGFIGVQLSSWGFIFGAIFALIRNKELKLYYIDKGIVNVKNERILGIVLITMSLISLVYTLSMILFFTVPYGIDVFSLSFTTNVFSGLILLLIMLIYGINSIIRAKKKNNPKL